MEITNNEPVGTKVSHLSQINIANTGSVISNIFSNNLEIKISLSFISVFGEWIFGGDKEALIVVFVLLIIDTLTGLIKAAKKSKVSSAGFFRFSVKMVVYLIMMATSSLVDKSLPLALAAPVMYTFLAATEGISILENIGEAGFPVPNALIKTLQVLKDKNIKDDPK